MLKSTYSSKGKRVSLVFLSFLVIFFLGIRTAQSDSVIESGTTVTVTSGTTVIEMGDLKVSDGGVLTNNGTLILKGDFNNENTAPTTIGGMVEFSGTSAQEISGENTFNNLTLNNANGLTINDNTGLTGTLTWTTGLINIGANDFSFHGTASYTGTPGTSAMFVADGAGKVQKEWTATGAFTFPIGDVSPDYTPIDVDITAGSNFTDFYLGANLVDAKYPDASIIDSYLTRYWNLDQAGTVDGPEADLTFHYLSSDVEGTETEIYTTKVNPNPWESFDVADDVNHLLTANTTHFSTWTGTKGAMEVNLTVFLEGPYAGSGLMDNYLRQYDFVPTDQPYNEDPWFYSGNEQQLTLPADVVDWVLIELREASDPSLADASTIFGKRAGFVLTDGSIVDMNGSNVLRFLNRPPAPSENLYVVVKHRNHFPVMANYAVTKDANGVYVYDYTDDCDKTYGCPDGIKYIYDAWTMVGGEGYHDGEINGLDISLVWDPQYGEVGYFRGDYFMDGEVEGTYDYSQVWDVNYAWLSPIFDGGKQGRRSIVP